VALEAGEAVEHEVEELGIAGFGPEDVAGHAQGALLLGLEDAHPEGAFEID
jgi:hypothetical protein